ncbi:N-acetyltransferase domain-containing protein [Pleurotus pulmonarius]
MEPSLSNYLPEGTNSLLRSLQVDEKGNNLSTMSAERVVVTRKLKLDRERQLSGARLPRLEATPGTLDGKEILDFSSLSPFSTPQHQTLEALYKINRTPYESSFLSRHHGNTTHQIDKVLALDYETISPWMALMGDLREHYRLLHPNRQQPSGSVAPIVYSCLREWHLDQVHGLLHQMFWAGISVSDSLDYSPERCTVVACYKRLVVGVAILSSPQETYITYLAVKTGWEGSKIATNMLYHLISMNPGKDISLHVSANNPAMLLYNRFGFKAEEFIVGFYEDYLDRHSHASKNAFRLRLRQGHRN